MAFDVSALTAYVDENRFDLISKTVYTAPSLQLFNIQTGIKGATTINISTVDANFQDCACSFNPDGSMVFTQRLIDVACIQVMDEFCEKDLLNYYTRKFVRIAAGKESMGAIEPMLVDDVIKVVLTRLDKAIYQGDTDSADENLNKFDGFIKILDNEADTVKYVAPAGESYYTTLTKIYGMIPTKAYRRGDVSILMGLDLYRPLIASLSMLQFLTSANTPTSNSERNVNGIPYIVLPGSNIRVYGVEGLDGTGRVIAGSLNDFSYGTDMEHDEERIKFWYSDDNQVFRYAIKFLAGVQVAFPDEVVIGTFADDPASLGLPVDLVNQPIQTTAV